MATRTHTLALETNTLTLTPKSIWYYTITWNEILTTSTRLCDNKEKKKKKTHRAQCYTSEFHTSNKGLRSFHQNTGKKWRKKKQRRKMVSICELRMQMKHELKINTSNLLALFYIHQQKKMVIFFLPSENRWVDIDFTIWTLVKRHVSWRFVAKCHIPFHRCDCIHYSVKCNRNCSLFTVSHDSR